MRVVSPLFQVSGKGGLTGSGLPLVGVATPALMFRSPRQDQGPATCRSRSLCPARDLKMKPSNIWFCLAVQVSFFSFKWIFVFCFTLSWESKSFQTIIGHKTLRKNPKEKERITKLQLWHVLSVICKYISYQYWNHYPCIKFQTLSNLRCWSNEMLRRTPWRGRICNFLKIAFLTVDSPIFIQKQVWIERVHRS